MSDCATPNLPARSFDETEAFYGKLGFERGWRDGGWMILRRGAVQLEFFPYPDLDPAASSFGCCLRLDEMPAFVETCRAAGIAEGCAGWPRLHLPRREDSGLDIAYLVDHDGSLLRLVQNA